MTFLLSSDDVRARLLRQHFVFKVQTTTASNSLPSLPRNSLPSLPRNSLPSLPRTLTAPQVIPCLNPDGVALGHYRADTAGNNLNRFYDNPDAQHHPTVLGVKLLLKGLHDIGR
jgi:hypothetical protein